MTGSYRVMFLVCAVFVATALVSGLGVSTYGAAKPPKQVLDRVEETRRSFGGEAHVSPIRATRTTSVTRTGITLTLTVSLRGLPNHVNASFFVLDELYVNLQQSSGNSVSQSQDELWVKETQNKTLLARVALPQTSAKYGYRAIKMRGVFASWSGNRQKAGFLKLTLPSTQSQLASNLQSSKSYFVIYTFSATGVMPNPVNCDYYDVTVIPQSPLNTPYVTKICSPPDDLTFPFSASTLFDAGAAVRKSLRDNPVPGNEAVLRNPKCCHGTEAVSRYFVGLDSQDQVLRTVELENVRITECGCGLG